MSAVVVLEGDWGVVGDADIDDLTGGLMVVGVDRVLALQRWCTSCILLKIPGEMAAARSQLKAKTSIIWCCSMVDDIMRMRHHSSLFIVDTLFQQFEYEYKQRERLYP